MPRNSDDEYGDRRRRAIPGEQAPAWAKQIQRDMRLVLQQLECLMADISRLKAAIDNMQSRDNIWVEAMVALRDANASLKAELEDLATRVEDPELQGQLNALAAKAEETSDMIEKSLTDNPNVPNPPPPPADEE